MDMMKLTDAVIRDMARKEQGDTISGPARAQMMQALHRLGGDTTRMSQEGIHRMMTGTLLDSMRTAYNNPHATVNLYAEPTNVGGWVDMENAPEEINANVLHAFLPDTRANVRTTPTEREMSPEDRLRQILLHEMGHASGIRSEYDSDLYAAAFDALSRAPEGTLRGEVEDSAASSYWNRNRNAYKEESWAGTPMYDEEGNPKPENAKNTKRGLRTRGVVRNLGLSEVFSLPPRTALGRWWNRVFGSDE